MIKFVKVVHKISSVLSIILFIAFVIVMIYPEDKCKADDVPAYEHVENFKSYEIVEPCRVYEPKTEYYHEHEVFEKERMNDDSINFYRSSLYEEFEYFTAKNEVEYVEEISTDCYDDLYLLAHLISGEAGADWCSDTMQLYVGSVALNRVHSEYFPNSLYDVIYQSGQYACTWDGNFDREPTQRCWDTAQYLLDNGSILPENVVYQAEFTQGDGIYAQEQNMYFCFYN